MIRTIRGVFTCSRIVSNSEKSITPSPVRSTFVIALLFGLIAVSMLFSFPSGFPRYRDVFSNKIASAEKSQLALPYRPLSRYPDRFTPCSAAYSESGLEFPNR